MDWKNVELVYNAAAHFKMMEKYPEGNIMKVISEGGAEGFEAMCEMIAECSTQAEMIRRSMGYDRREPITAERIRIEMMPYEWQEAFGALCKAFMKGMKAPDDPMKEHDEVLEELEKKTEDG